MDADERTRRKEIVVTQNSGILPYTEAFYLSGLIYAGEAAFSAFGRYENAISSGHDASDVASAIHECLGHAAALSRFFWPTRANKLAAARGEKLRMAFDVRETSPLKSRRLRDTLEHFDERLDAHLLNDLVGEIIPQPIVAASPNSSDSIRHIFKLVDPVKGAYIVLGERFDFLPIVNEVGRILDHTYEMFDNGARLSSIAATH